MGGACTLIGPALFVDVKRVSQHGHHAVVANEEPLQPVNLVPEAGQVLQKDVIGSLVMQMFVNKPVVV